MPAALGSREGSDVFGFDILAAVLVLVLTGILVLGMKLSARVTTVVVAIKVTVVLVVIIASTPSSSPPTTTTRSSRTPSPCPPGTVSTPRSSS